jgi:hypothetical protein
MISTCAVLSAHGMVGETVHNWSLSCGVGRLGIIEWTNGSSTLFLGVTSFDFPFGGYTLIAAMVAGLGAVIGAVLGCRSILRGKHRSGAGDCAKAD